MNFDIRSIKAAFPPTQVLDHFGHAYKLRGKTAHGLCPFHDERTPSFTVTDSRGTFHCFGCNKHGDSVDLWMELGGVGKGDAIRAMAGHLGLAPDQTSPDVALTRRIARELIRERADAAKTRERLRLNALAVRAYHAERAGRWYREAARLTPDRDEALPLIWQALAAEEVAEICDRESGWG